MAGVRSQESDRTSLTPEPVRIAGHTPYPTPATYTPKHLAEKILTSKSAFEGERKQVTVLFAHRKGSLELLADRDPEEARKLLDPVLEHMMEAVHRYEGTVNQVMGDGIMALFGAPLAHEDHAVRACYAALRMQESVQRYDEEARRAYGLNVQIRVGLNSGEVVVRSIGSDLRMDYTAVGQTTDLAARMEQLASPGSILLAPDTFQLAGGFVTVKVLGPVSVKGLSEPVEAYELLGAGIVRSRLQAAIARGLTRFVGREAELEQLHRALDRAATGQGQMVAVVGEPGVGKSRFVYELTHSPRLQGWLVLEAPSVPYGQATSHLPAIELLKGYFQIQDRDDVAEIRNKLTSKLLALDDSLGPALLPLLALLDVPVDDGVWSALDPGQRRQRMLDAVKRLLLRESEKQPLLLIFEDLQWIDRETEVLLDALVDGLPTAPVLLLVNYRPEYEHAWVDKTCYSQLRLDALPTESSGELLDALLGEDPGLVPLKQRLVKWGNPFFLEETVQTLVETKALEGERGRYRLTRPIQTIQLPATVQEMLAARIERLAPEDKRLLQTAAVIGRDVPFALLAAVTDLEAPGLPDPEAAQQAAALPNEPLRRVLDSLQAAEFLYETGLYPDLEYTFKHTLTHEITYGGLLQERRRELHARIVEAIEALHRDRLDAEIERLAYHTVRGELWEKAVRYLRQAGLKAAARSALQDAWVCFEQALGILEALPESRSTLEQAFEIRLELRQVLNQLGEVRRMLERLREAEALAERLNDDRRRAQVYAFLMNIRSLLGELDEALLTSTRALEVAERLGDLRFRILTTSLLELLYYYRGNYEQVVQLATDNLVALPAEWAYEYFGNIAPVSVYDRVGLVLCLSQLGRFAEAASYEAEAIRLAEPTRHAFTIGLAHFAASTLYLLKGDWAQATPLVEGWIAGVRRGNVALQIPWAVAASAWMLAQLGEASEALNRLREGEQLLERQAATGIVGHHGWAYQALGRAGRLLGRLDEARHLGARAIEYSPCHPGFEAHALHLLGDIATHPEQFDADSGEAYYRQALALAEPRGMRPLVAHCHLGLGRLYRRMGKREQASEHLATAGTMYCELGMTFWLEQAEAESRMLA